LGAPGVQVPGTVPSLAMGGQAAVGKGRVLDRSSVTSPRE
jgi:hypothetical protein